ncbi:MAG: helix-turn-helix domain-containing protein [Terriglobia bacterium]
MARKINRNLYDGLREALTEVRAYERGARVDLRVTEIPAIPKPIKPDEIRRIRESLHASQAVFAHFLCVSPKAVQSWEQGTRRPQSTALRLLAIARENPQVLLQS